MFAVYKSASPRARRCGIGARPGDRLNTSKPAITALTSKTNQSKPAVLLTHFMYLLHAFIFAAPLDQCHITAGSSRAVGKFELNSVGHQTSIKMSIRMWHFGCATHEMCQCVACTTGGIQWSHKQHARNHAVCMFVPSIGHSPSIGPGWDQANKTFTAVGCG